MHYCLFSVFFVLAAGFLAALTTPVAPDWDIMQMKHAWNSVPMNWERLGPPPTGTTIKLHIFLKPHHQNALINALYEVSNPEHPKYGAHLAKEQVADLLAPHPDTLELVSLWLEHRGVSSSISTTLGGSWLTLTGVPVSQANDLLGASFQLYQHTGTKDIVLRTVSYALPAVLHAHVDTVVPTTYFGSPRAQMKTPRVQRGDNTAMMTKAEFGEPATLLSSRAGYTSPPDLRSLYNTENYVPAAAGRNVLGTVGYGGSTPSMMDLRAFMNLYRTDGADATFTLVQLNGGTYDPNNPGVEGDVNIEYASAIAYPTPNVYYSVGEAFEDGYIAWLHDVLNQLIVPQTIVTTYGDLENTFPADHAVRLCNLFAALGARGVSVLFASGNSGVGPEDCTVTDSFGNVHVQFTPVFPASCPYLTAVGGTMSKDPEIAAPFSGGGFSNLFQRPDYQDLDNAVQTFLQKLGSQYNGFYNAEGRGYPDISAQGWDFLAVHRKKVVFKSGTSCATPTVGAIITLLNDYRISQGKHPLGFLNPWLYGGGLAGLNDITSGSNPGCKTNGFPAVVGWDPVTGLGTPDFVKLLRIIEKMEN
ncbi:peptidase S8/S53 domain-containing protein [Lactarius quietus]|nr:peptidase S8/S53 domain-containing protein [Lactarius quietus]